MNEIQTTQEQRDARMKEICTSVTNMFGEFKKLRQESIEASMQKDVHDEELQKRISMVRAHIKKMFDDLMSSMQDPEFDNLRVATREQFIGYINETYLPNILNGYALIEVHEHRQIITTQGVVIEKKVSPTTFLLIKKDAYNQIASEQFKKNLPHEKKPLVNEHDLNKIEGKTKKVTKKKK